MTDNPFVGSWTYRSFRNDPTPFLDGGPTDAVKDELYGLVFGNGTITIREGASQILHGAIGGPGWQLELTGSRSYGNPMEVRFQGKGVIGGAQWIYDYVGYLVPHWPNGADQRPAMVGSIVRAIPHPGDGGTVHPAGVVASWYAVRQDAE